MVTPLLGGFGWQEMLIILAIVLILFGGSRLAGLGKSTGRALREFKEETKDMTDGKKKDAAAVEGPAAHDAAVDQTPVTGEVVEPRTDSSSTETRRDG